MNTNALKIEGLETPDVTRVTTVPATKPEGSVKEFTADIKEMRGGLRRICLVELRANLGHHR